MARQISGNAKYPHEERSKWRMAQRIIRCGWPASVFLVSRVFLAINSQDLINVCWI